ncbi:MAG: hypothetical protein WC967_15835 [Balneolaceae bacterium]
MGDLIKFRNEAYSDLVSDLILDAFYIERPNRGKVASIRQYAEVVVRKILDLPESEKVTLGDRAIVEKLKERSDNNQLLMSSVNTIRLDGNNCTHTQETGPISEQDVQNCIDCLFNMYASIFVLYFKKYKFGANNEVMSAFSILPPIVRYLTLNELYQQSPENLSIIDKLSLVLLKAFDKDQAISWIEDRKEELSQMLPYTEEAIEKIKSTYGEIVAQQVIDNAPESMYDLCVDRIIEVEEIINRNGLLYNNFEQAKQLYLEKGVLLGSGDEIQEFNSIMEFVYLGRKEEPNSNLEKLESYVVTE